MTDDKTFDLFDDPHRFGDAARAGRDKGMREAAAHAEAEVPAWGELALRWVRVHANLNPGKPFTTLECRKAGYDNLLPVPPTNFAWGSVMVRAVREGIIERVGTTNVGDKTSHLKLAPLWCSKAGHATAKRR